VQFKYTYQDREGRIHEAEIGSPSQAEAYSALRKSGIRPMRVWPADGSATVRPFRIGKRVLALVVGVTAVAVGILAYTMGRNNAVRAPQTVDERPAAETKESPRSIVSSNIVEVRPGKRIAKPRPRRQLELPDEAAIAEALPHPVERLLVRYAQPGKLTHKPLPDLSALEDDFYTAQEEVLWIDPSDEKSLVELKRVVQTLKNEAEERTLDGATFKDVIDWFEQRQKMEAAYRESVISKHPKDAANRLLQAMSLELIP